MKENEYYDLIVEMIKAHRKFTGCEDILDDIVEDVKIHAESVLESVENEDVIKSYLEKVVSTSIITVPKRFNISSRPKREPLHFDNIVEKDADSELNIDKSEEEESVDFQDSDNMLIQQSYSDEDSASLVDEELLDNGIELTLNEEAESVDLEPDVNIELVDKMINGAENTHVELETELTVDDSDEYSELEKYNVEDDSVKNIDSSSEYVESDNSESGIPEENLSYSEEDVENIFDSDVGDDSEHTSDVSEAEMEEQVDEVDYIENSDESEPLISDDEDINVSTLESDGNIMEDISEDISEVEALPLYEEENKLTDLGISATSEDSLIIEASENIEEIEPAEDLFEQDELDSKVQETEVLSNIQNDSVAMYESPLYESFKYEPYIPGFDNTSILESIKNIDEESPEKCLLKIYKLKYEDDKTVSEIAKSIGLSEQSVIEALDEVIKLLKG